MSLLTLERSSPSPHESENEDLLSTSSYEGFVARDHYALCLTPRPITSLGPGRRGDHMRIFSHLKKLVKLLRPADKLKLAVELENSMPRRVTKYMVVIVTHGNQDTDETIVLGTEQEDSNIRIGLVLPLWRDTEIKLDGDGGFSVHTGDRQHVFKPLSVQSMWTALQTLYKCTEHARLNNHYVGGLSHTWMAYYTTRLTTDGSILNEWNLSEDVESFRPDSPIYTGDISNRTEETRDFEKVLSHNLRQIMLEQDLEETTSRQLRLLLENEVGMELKEYREFLDRQMLRILGQMERPSQIYDYLFLGSEWNASNLSELKDLGVKYILNITKEIDNFYPEEFKYLNVRLYDVPGSELMKHWDKTYKFIKEAKLSGKKVLVHCKMGISRSAATVIAYTMKEYNMSLEEALEHVKGKRSVVNPNDGFVQQLKDYEGILRARHNDLWGKKAPSRLRLHPLEMSRKLFHSEPNLPDYQEHPLRTAEPELSFLPEEGPDEQVVKEAQSLHSLFPKDHSVPIDKHQNIRNFLASLPPAPVTIDDDQGVGGDIPYTSESGSGYSTPNLSPTDDEHFNLRYQKLLSKKTRSLSMAAGLEMGEKSVAGGEAEIKSEGEVTCNVVTQDPPQTEEEGEGQTTAEPESCDAELKSCDVEKRHPVAVVNQISFIIKNIEVESVSVPGSVEPSSLSPNPSSNVSLNSQPLMDEESGNTKQATFRLGSEEPDGVMSPLPQEAAGTVMSPLPQEAAGTVESPQIHSVPERVKEIEKLNSKSDSNLGKPESSKVMIPLIMSRNSSVHSALSSCDQELTQLEQTTPSSPPRPTSIRHVSLSPSPPSAKRLAEHVRHSSLSTLVTVHNPLPELSSKCDSEDILSSSLRGAVRSRVLDIEEKGRDPVAVVVSKQSCVSEKSDSSVRSLSPTSTARIKSDKPLTERPASADFDELSAVKSISSPPQDNPPPKARMTRRESTPPAVFSAWRPLLPTEDVPPPQVDLLKRKYEDLEVEAKVGRGLRRSQSLRSVRKPSQRTGRASTSSPEQGAGPSSEGDKN